MVAYDHKYVIAEGVATVNRLISKDEVKYLSILGGAVAKANEEAVNEAGVLALPLAYAEGLVSPKNPLTFHSFPSPPETTTFWKWIKEHHPEIKRLATISPNDDTGWWSIKVETQYTEKLGYQTVAKEFFERGLTDFNPILLRMLAQNPDIISVNASPAGSVGLIIKQARELGFKGRFHPYWPGRYLGRVWHCGEAERRRHVGARLCGDPAAGVHQELEGALHQEVR